MTGAPMRVLGGRTLAALARGVPLPPQVSLGLAALAWFWPQNEAERRVEWRGASLGLECPPVPTYDDGTYYSWLQTTNNPGCLTLQAITGATPLPYGQVGFNVASGTWRLTISDRRFTTISRYAYRQLIFVTGPNTLTGYHHRPKPARGPLPANEPDASPVPRPFHEPAPFARPMDEQNPWAEPGIRPAEVPSPRPGSDVVEIPGYLPLVLPRPAPGLGTNPGVGVAPTRPPKPYEVPAVQISGPPGGRFSRPTGRPHRVGPPRPRTREAKITGGALAALFKAFINFVTETSDVVDAMFNAIPKAKRIEDRVLGLRNPISRAEYIGENWQAINWEIFAANLVKNQFEDAVYGLLGQADRWRYQQTNSAGFNQIGGSRMFDGAGHQDQGGRTPDNPVIDAFNDFVDTVVKSAGYSNPDLY